MENFDIGNLNKVLQQSFIHYDPNRTDYTINNSEMIQLEEAGNNFWKDIFFVCLGLSLPSLLNAYLGKCKIASGWNDEIFCNALLGGITLIICILSGILWYKTNKRFSKIIENIKSKPIYKIPG